MRRLWAAVLLCSTPVVAVGVSTPERSAAAARDRQIMRTLTRASQFAEVPHLNTRRVCGDVQPPEALMTPDPLFSSVAYGRNVKVSFIIGIDGRVHSPLILESAGLAGDRHVLQTVRTWRYRPATCNGVPTETEGKVEFSSR